MDIKIYMSSVSVCYCMIYLITRIVSASSYLPRRQASFPGAQLTGNSRGLSSKHTPHQKANWKLTCSMESGKPSLFDSFLPFSNLCWLGCSHMLRDAFSGNKSNQFSKRSVVIWGPQR